MARHIGGKVQLFNNHVFISNHISNDVNGIRLQNCPGADVRYNSVYGSSTSGVISWNASGIRSDLSNGASFWCNSVNLGRPVYVFLGRSPRKVQGNRLYNGKTGITIDNAVIGPQAGNCQGSNCATLLNPLASMNSWSGAFEKHTYSNYSNGQLSPLVLANVIEPQFITRHQ
jgi:hypothetical protein